MGKEVTLRALNKVYASELFTSGIFWWGFGLYIIGVICFFAVSRVFGGVVMLIAALIMLSADYRGRQRVVKHLRWA